MRCHSENYKSDGLTKNKKKEKVQITNVRNGRSKVTWDLENIKIIKLYFRRRLVLPKYSSSLPRRFSLFLLKTLDITQKKQKKTLEVAKKQGAAWVLWDLGKTSAESSLSHPPIAQTKALQARPKDGKGWPDNRRLLCPFLPYPGHTPAEKCTPPLVSADWRGAGLPLALLLQKQVALLLPCWVVGIDLWDSTTVC